jgi:hypothetical protein
MNPLPLIATAAPVCADDGVIESIAGVGLTIVIDTALES